jgi:endo-1,4-beta-xylanase
VLNVPCAEAAADFDRHITETVSRYAGKITWWDVVNEPIEPAHGRADGLRSKTWLKVFGPAYIERAFNLVHTADPNAKLFMNERALALIDVAHPNCREELLAAAKRLGYVRPEQYLVSQAAYPVHESARSSSRTAPRS